MQQQNPFLNTFKNTFLKELLNPTPKPKQITVDFNEFLDVDQGHVGELTTHDHQSIIGSTHASTCFILIIYDEKNKKAVSAHIDAAMPFKALIRGPISKLQAKYSTAYLVGGSTLGVNFQSMMQREAEIRNFVAERNQIEFGLINTCTPFKGTVSLALNVKTGEVIGPGHIVAYKKEESLEQNAFRNIMRAHDLLTNTLPNIIETAMLTRIFHKFLHL